MIELRLLGPVIVTVDGAPPAPELLWKKNLALLAYLALSPRGRRTRDHLVGLLWGDREEAAARHSLREAVRVLRKAVGERGISTEGDQVALADDAVRTDTAALTAMLLAEEWEKGAALVEGELLEGFAVPEASEFEDWLIAERRSWARRGAEALLRAGEVRYARGDPEGAARVADRILRGGPGSDPATFLLMRALALSGDPTGALRAFDQAELRREAGSRPAPELAALAARLRRGDGGGHSGRAPRQMRPETEGRRAPLVGAGGVLERMLECWGEVRTTGAGQLIVLSAHPGFGKTRLTGELLERARLDGASIARVRAVSADREEPGAALIGLARGGLLDAAGCAGARPEALAALATVIPEWADAFPHAARDVTPLPLGAGFAEVVRAAVAEGPLVLLLDDADWIDDSSFGTLEGIARELSSLALLVVIASSGQLAGAPIDQLRVRIGRDVAGVSLTLGPLDHLSLEGLARWALPSYPAEQLIRVVRRVEADSAGIPLLAVELLSAIAAGLEVEGTSAPWPATARTLDQTRPGDLPDLLLAAIRVGFRTLSREAQGALAAAAVLGDRVDAVRIGRGASLSDPAAALDELEWTRWLVAESRGYSFVARIVREVVARDLVTAGQRQRILDLAGP